MFDMYNMRKASIGYYDPIFRNLLERGQNMHPDLFTTGVFIGYFSIIRIPRRGTITDAENKNVDNIAINLINKCRNRESVRGTEVGLSI